MIFLIQLKDFIFLVTMSACILLFLFVYLTTKLNRNNNDNK